MERYEIGIKNKKTCWVEKGIHKRNGFEHRVWINGSITPKDVDPVHKKHPTKQNRGLNLPHDHCMHCCITWWWHNQIHGVWWRFPPFRHFFALLFLFISRSFFTITIVSLLLFIQPPHSSDILILFFSGWMVFFCCNGDIAFLGVGHMDQGNVSDRIRLDYGSATVQSDRQPHNDHRFLPLSTVSCPADLPSPTLVIWK